jgi:hypothetical protein
VNLLSELLPLKKTSALGAYKQDAILPWVYGDLSSSPIKLVWLTDNTYIAAAWPCQEVVGVQIDKQETAGFNASILQDAQGNSYQAIELAAPAPDGSLVTATLKGKVSVRTGALMENPAEIIEDIHLQIGSVVNLSDFYNECNNDDLKIAGVIDSAVSARAAINEICESVGAIWTRKTARLYPAPVPQEQVNTFQRYDLRNVKNLKASASIANAADGLRFEFDYQQASSEFGAYVELLGKPARYLKQVSRSAKWLRGNATAVKVGARKLERLAGTLLSLSFESDTMFIEPGQWAYIDHPLLPVSAYIMILSANKSLSKNQVRITAEMIVEKPQVIVVLNSAQRISPTQSAAVDVAIDNNLVTFTIKDSDGRAISGAETFLDGVGPRISDAGGKVTFDYLKGAHILGVEAAGYVPFELEVQL